MDHEASKLQGLENPRLVVKKGQRQLQIFDGDELVKIYEIGLGFSPSGDKQAEGDGRTPEGEFYVFTKNDKSKFYLSLGLSYPNIKDAERGFEEKLISQAEYDEIVEAVTKKQRPPQNTALGGEIYIHGGGTLSDWTRGCVALKDEEMREIFDLIPIGAGVKIEP